MKYNSKDFLKQNYFVLYDINDNILYYFDNFTELSKIFNYRLYNLVHHYNISDTNVINVVIDNQKYKLATFVAEGGFENEKRYDEKNNQRNKKR